MIYLRVLFLNTDFSQSLKLVSLKNLSSKTKFQMSRCQRIPKYTRIYQNEFGILMVSLDGCWYAQLFAIYATNIQIPTATYSYHMYTKTILVYLSILWYIIFTYKLLLGNKTLAKFLP